MNIFKPLLCFTFIGCCYHVRAQNSLSFHEAQDLMFQKNKEVKVNDKKIEKSLYDEKVAKSLSYPQISAEGLATWLNKDIALDNNPARNKVADFLNIPDPNTLGSWILTLQKKDIQLAAVSAAWPIFVGGKIRSAQNAANIKTNIAKTEKSSSEQGLISELAERYYLTKLSAEAVKLRQQVLNDMNMHYSDAQKMEKNGVIAGAETLQVQVAVANADKELKGAIKDFQLAKTALGTTLESDSISDSLSSPFFLLDNMLPLKEYKDMASQNYPEIEKLKLMEKLTEQSMNMEKADFFPTIALTGQKVVASNNFNIPGIKNPLLVGVSAKYNLFDGFGRRSRIKAAESQKDVIKLSREKAELDITAMADKLYKELQKQEEQIQALKISQNLAVELIRVRSKAFAEGMASSTEVIDAETNKYSVDVQILQAYSQYDITLAQLYELCGISNQYSNQIH